MPQAPRSHRIPAGLECYLRATGRRVRSLQVVRGLLATLGIGLVGLLLAMAAHAVFAPESHLARWGISLSLLALTGWAFWRSLVLPLRHPLDRERLAAVLDARHPEGEERLSSALDFAQRGLRDLAKKLLGGGSSRKAPEGTEAAHREFGVRHISRPLVGAGLVGLLLLGILVLWPHEAGRLLVRSLNPAADVGNALAPRMQVDPGTDWVAKGEPVTITLRFFHRAAESAVLTRIRGEGEEAVITEESMELVRVDEAAGYARFELCFPAVEEGFRYRISSRRGVSDTYQLDVRPYPALESLTAEIRPPAYTRAERTEVATVLKEGLRAVEGSSIRLQGVASVPLQSASLELAAGGARDATQRKREEKTHLSWDLKANGDLRGDATAVLEDDLALRAEVAGIPIEVVPDMPPGLILLSPIARHVRLEEGEEVSLGFEASDDFGVPYARLVVERPGQETFERPVARPLDSDRARWQSACAVGASLAGKVKGSLQMTAWLETSDNRPDSYGGAQHASSQPVLIEVLERGWRERIEQAKDRDQGMKLVEQAIAELERAAKQAQAVEARLGMSGQPLDGRSRQNQRATLDYLEKADAHLREASKAFSSAGEKATQEQVDGVRIQDLLPARDATAKTVSSPTPSQRLRAASDTRREVKEAIENLGGALEENQLSKEEMEELMNLLAQMQEEMAQQMQDPQEGDPSQQSLLQKQMDLAKLLESLREQAPP